MSPRGSSGRMRGLGVASACAFACALGFGLGAGAPQARAAEDGGTQSVFAYGAGNRALAMGTAFVATADDASAVLWNPAGLGRLPRAELQGVQSLELGFGVTESYVAVALPNWRWGTGGLVFRHFGVGDIDARDARNVPLGGEIKDSEIEVALGYGRALNDTWSLGGAVKLQHQSLAGYSGSGLGVDLGVHARPASLIGLRAPWADGLRWGLSLRNAVAPAIRLDQESVSDPFSWRSGLAWQTVTPGGQGFLAEIDVSKAASTNPNLCAGLEFRLHPAAAMRLGMNDGMFTAGVGLQLRDVSVEYAFENQEIATSHRAGVRFQFGATTEESRLAELRREDEQVERRLAEAFQERQKEQVAGMLERANAAQVRGELDEALGILALLDTLEPGHPEARALQIAILKEKARRLEEGEEFASAAIVWSEALALAPADSSVALGIARCREESDRRARRTNEIRVRFAQAMDAFAAGELERARADFRAVLDVDAADREARRMLERTEQALARRALESARRTAEAARAEHATTARADTTLAATAPSRAPSQAKAPAASAAPARAVISDREAEDLYRRGLASLRSGRTDDALRYWELVWSARPDYREVAANLKREYLARGLEAFAVGRLNEAIQQWERVLRIDPNDARARGYLERAEQQRAKSREILGSTP